MPEFRPFVGTLYAPESIPDFGQVVAPPYDVIDEEERARLAALHPNNAVHLILAQGENGLDRYEVAAQRLSQWLESGVLVDDPEPSFYVCKMGFRDDRGTPRQTTGVIGLVGIDSEGAILPHEETLPKPLGDQLSLLRATRANLSPIYLLTLGGGLTQLLNSEDPPRFRCTDSEGTHHRIWSISAPAVMDTISELISEHPLVIADGHHRYQTAAEFHRIEQSRESGYVMAMVVEFTPDQLWVRPTHRIFLDVDPDDMAEAFHRVFGQARSRRIPPDPNAVETEIAEERAVLVTQGNPPEVVGSEPYRDFAADPREVLAELPVSRLHEKVLPSLPVVGRVAYEPDVSTAFKAVVSGDATAAVFLPGVDVATIRLLAEAGLKTPQKTTYFAPKVRTGSVFRHLDSAIG